MGVRLLQSFAEDVAEFGTVESTPTIDGRNMVMVIGPLKNKADAKAEANAQRRGEGATGGGCPGRAESQTAEPTEGQAKHPRRHPLTRTKRNKRMPKQKTHSGSKKRFKVTGSGKIMKQQAGMRHNLEVKSSQRKRRLNQDRSCRPATPRSSRSFSATKPRDP